MKSDRQLLRIASCCALLGAWACAAADMKIKAVAEKIRADQLRPVIVALQFFSIPD